MLEKKKDIWFLLGFIFLFFLLRLPSLFEPYWYGDEGIYHVIGQGLNHGRILYKEIWDNKTPLLYVLYAFMGSDQFSIKLLSLLFGVGAIGTFFILARKLVTSWAPATFLFTILLGLPFLEGNIANAENFMLLPIILAGLLIFYISANNNYTLNAMSSFSRRGNYTLFSAGLLLSLAFLFKTVAVFDTAAFFLFFLFMQYKKDHERDLARKSTFFIAGGIVPVSITILYFLCKGALWDFFSAAFVQNVGYVGYANTLIIPQGWLLLKLSLLTISMFFLFKKRENIEKPTLFVLIWFLFSLSNAFFSQRPYTHYVLVLLPSFCLMVGLLWPNKRLSLEKKQQRNRIGIFFVLSVLLVSISFNFYGKTIWYYQNFTQFIVGKKSVAAYQSFFDRNTPNDYAVASFLKIHTNEKDTIFIWGNNAQIYTLVNKLPPGRYTVAYHITASEKTIQETQDALLRTKPKYIVVSPQNLANPFYLGGYAQRLVLDNAIIYERIF